MTSKVGHLHTKQNSKNEARYGKLQTPIFNIAKFLWNERISIELNFSLHRHFNGMCLLISQMGIPFSMCGNHTSKKQEIFQQKNITINRAKGFRIHFHNPLFNVGNTARGKQPVNRKARSIKLSVRYPSTLLPTSKERYVNYKCSYKVVIRLGKPQQQSQLLRIHLQRFHLEHFRVYAVLGNVVKSSDSQKFVAPFKCSCQILYNRCCLLKPYFI